MSRAVDSLFTLQPLLTTYLDTHWTVNRHSSGVFNVTPRRKLRRKHTMFLLLSVFVLASVASPEVAPDCCQELRQCVHDLAYGPNGTWLWVFMPTLPAHNDWIDYINGTCNDWQGRSACNTSPFREACKNYSLTRYARYERFLTPRLCSPRGRQFLERIYTEVPQCLGNDSLSREALGIMNECLAERGLTDLSYRGDCANATAARDCWREWVGERCGDLFRWIIDVMWDERFRVFYPNCPRPSRSPWPSS